MKLVYKRLSRRGKIVVLLSFCLLLFGCQKKDPQGSDSGQVDKNLQVAVVNYPLAYFAERIGGDQVDVIFPVPADVDPAFWKPTPDDISRYQTSDLILLNGASYAGWVKNASLPDNKLVHSSKAYEDQLIVTMSEVHSHGPGEEHSHEETAFTTWLDTDLALLQAQAVRDALVRKQPAKKESFEANYAGLERDLKEIDESLKKTLEPLQDEPLLYSHPVYQYFDRRYQLSGESVHWEPGEMPSEELWQELDQIVGHNPARVMLWEGKPLAETAAKLKEKGIESVVFEPMGNKPAEGDYLSVRKAGVESLDKALQASSTSGL